MRCWLLLLSIWSGLGVAATSPEKPMLGIIEMPRLFGENVYYQWLVNKEAIPFPVSVYSEPSQNAALLVQLQQPNQIEAIEYGYEVLGPVVYSKVDGWFQIRLQPKSSHTYGWVKTEDAGKFFAYESLLEERLTYFREDKALVLYQGPDGKLLEPPIKLTSESMIDVLEHTKVNSRLWFKVRIYDKSECEGEAVKALGDAWVPGYLPDGRTSIWFFTRGC